MGGRTNLTSCFRNIRNAPENNFPEKSEYVKSIKTQNSEAAPVQQGRISTGRCDDDETRTECRYNIL
jgi:hypothetical protein